MTIYGAEGGLCGRCEASVGTSNSIVLVIVYTYWRRLHRVEERHGSESIVAPQCIIDLMLVVYN